MLEETTPGYAFARAVTNESLLELREGKKFTRRRKDAKEEKEGGLLVLRRWMEEPGAGLPDTSAAEPVTIHETETDRGMATPRSHRAAKAVR